MSYKIELTDNFKKEAKKLIKKYARYVQKLQSWAKNLHKTLHLALRLEMMFIKYALPLLPKIKESQAVQGLLLL